MSAPHDTARTSALALGWSEADARPLVALLRAAGVAPARDLRVAADAATFAGCDGAAYRWARGRGLVPTTETEE